MAVEVTDPHQPRPVGAPDHLTLRFLGEVALDRVPVITDRLATVAGSTAPFTIRLEGIGAFPGPDRPRVVWVGVTVGREALSALARRVHDVLEPEVGPAPERFAPHLTLFRVRSSSDRTAAIELLAGRRPAPPPREVPVRELLLKESVLGRLGAVHRTLASLPLVGNPQVPV